MFGSSLAHIFIALAAASTAAAHGIIGSVSIDGRNYNGANGVRTSQDTPMRRVSTGSPIYNEYGNEIICGPNAGPARGVADANPGSRIQIFWTMENGGNWPHNTGKSLSGSYHAPLLFLNSTNLLYTEPSNAKKLMNS